MAGLMSSTAAYAGDVRIMWYSDGVEGEVMQDLLNRFMEENPGINVILDNVAYTVVQEQLPIQLEAGQGPDIARVTNLKAQSQHWLDLRPLVADAAYWDENFGAQADWMRPDGSDAITGFMTQITLTGGFANKTLFEQAGVAIPGPEATWDDWAKAARAVAENQQVPFAMALDRSGHRITGPNLSFGANYIGADGKPAPLDQGAKDFITKFVGWAGDGTMMKDVWVSAAGSTYRAAAEDFINGQLVYYYSGSWQVPNFAAKIGDGFDWVATGSPCGPAACTGMPGGAGLVAVKYTKNPAGRRQGDGLPGQRRDGEGILRAHPVPPGAQGRARQGARIQDRRSAGEGRAPGVHRRVRQDERGGAEAAGLALGGRLLRRARHACRPGGRGRADARRNLCPHRRGHRAEGQGRGPVSCNRKWAGRFRLATQGRTAVTILANQRLPTGLGTHLMAPVRLAMGAIDAPLRALQRVAGLGGMAGFFLLPNMLIFGIFVLLPLVINFVYSMTGGTAIFLDSRTFVGAEQYARLFDCQNYLDPNTCVEDAFWTAVGNTGWFVLLQVALMIGAALVTALILNRELKARGFWRAVFFFPVLLSPVVVGLIWRWILQRQGLLNFALLPFGHEPYAWLTDPNWAFAAAVGVSVWAHMGFYTLILLAGLQAIPKDLYEAAEMDGTQARARLLAHHPAAARARTCSSWSCWR